MAVRKIDQKVANPNGGGRLKFRYVDPERYVDLDVTHVDQHVADQFRSLVASLSSKGAAPPVRALTLGPTSTAAAIMDEEETQGGATIEEAAEETGADAGEETSGNGVERRRRIPPEPKVINDLDITAGPMPLKTFLEEKGSRNKAQDRLVMVATWLKKHKGYEEITRDHLYTCYQQMGGSGQWKAPNDFDTYIRTMAKRKRWFEPGTGQAAFKVTIIATNYVDGLTPAAA